MAKPRSPILGYNHNIRYRGLVFHVQTEDSGTSNPHVFTHLFHGGVILSTRKLVYDSTSAEDSVKGLMQAQHKAVLKDLKRGAFDDKMDSYLGGTPGLLPRGQGVDGEMTPSAAAPVAARPAPLPEPEPPLPPPVVTRVPTPASIAIPSPSRVSQRINAAGHDSIEARAPTERFSTDAHGASPLPPPPPSNLARGTDTTGASTRQSMAPPAVETRPVDNDKTERNVSAAFQAIMLEEGAAGRAGAVVEVSDDEPVIEIHSPAPGSAAPPPGFIDNSGRPGSYAQHRRRESGKFSPEGELLPPSGQALPPAQVAAAAKQAVTRGATSSQQAQRTTSPGPLARPPTPMTRPATAPPGAGTGRNQPLPTYPSGRPPSPAPGHLPRAQTQARTRSPSGGGVVVTRPAVIIGAPSRTVGGAPTTPPAPPPAAAAPPVHKQPSRMRKAREDSDAGLFGQDLISEKSLDEVILAYLSEDPAEE